MTPELVTAEDLAPSELDAFLARYYPAEKVTFLRDHGAWWHRGNHNRWVAMVSGAVAGYCAVIPARCLVGGSEVEALWWVDLVVAPEYRGLGLQRLFDERLKALQVLKLGFPNALAARIHRKHGWGVREHLRVRLLPLRPPRLRAVRTARGLAGAAGRVAAHALIPLGRLLRRQARSFRPHASWRCEEADAEALASVFHRFASPAVTTTMRDREYLQWRYLDAPYRGQLRFYAAGDRDSPALALITRTVANPWGKEVRVLDLFGDLASTTLIIDALRLAVRDGEAEEANQIALMSATKRLGSVARRVGFLVPSVARFCWLAAGPPLSGFEGSSEQHWVLGDGDNDDVPRH